jgi:hypothetical protein
MWQDPIVEEVHQIRHQLAAQCNNDLSLLVERAMQRQEDRAVQVANLRAADTTPSKEQLAGVQRSE